MAIQIRTLEAMSEDSLLALNNAHEAETSRLDGDRLRMLISRAFYASGIGDVDAFLIGFDERADYDSPNFLWFRKYYDTFVYIDRIITAPHARGLGMARALYDDLFARAATAGHRNVVCEVNLEPPNPGSDAFHKALDFGEVGRARILGGTRSVRYLARRVHKPATD